MGVGKVPLLTLLSTIIYNTKIKSGCSLTVEFAAGGREAGVRLSAPRHYLFIALLVSYLNLLEF